MEQLLATGLIAFVCFFIRAATGFGSSLIATPLLAIYLPFHQVVILMLLLEALANIILSRIGKTDIVWPEFKSLILGSLLGLPIGIFLLVKLPQSALLIMVGVVIAAFGLQHVLGWKVVKTLSPKWAPVAGFAGGAISGAFGTGGPPYVIYLSNRELNKSQIRGTLSLIFMIQGNIRMITFLLAGIVVPGILLQALAGFTGLLLGLKVGNVVHHRMNDKELFKALGILLVLNGIMAVANGWMKM